MSTILDRQKSILNVRRAQSRNAAPTAAALADLLAPELRDGERLPDFDLSQELFVRALERRWQRLTAAEEARLDAEQRLARQVELRDEAVSRLYHEVGHLRMVLKGIFGAEAAALLIALTGDTSRDPLRLLRQAWRAVGLLLDVSLPLPPSKAPRSEDDRRRWAAPVAAAAKALEPLVEAASLATKALDAARLERKRALESFNAAFVGIAGWLAATYLVSGREVWAQAIQPSGWRKGLTHAVARKQRPKAAQAPDVKAEPARAGAAEPAPKATGESAQVLPFEPLRRFLGLMEPRRQTG